MTLVRNLATVVLLSGAAATAARAQTDSGAGRTPAGTGDQDQAARGQAVFQRTCSACHAIIQFSSPGFRSGWNGRSVFELYEQIRTTMPLDNPGRLRRGQYADVTAWLLKLNGQPPPAAELSTDTTALRGIQIQLPTDSRSP